MLHSDDNDQERETRSVHPVRCSYPRCPAHVGDCPSAHKHDPDHVIAREDALDDAFDTLWDAHGHGEYKTASQALDRRMHRVRTVGGASLPDDTDDPETPKSARLLQRYLEDIEFECIQELFAQLASWTPQSDQLWSAWPPPAMHEEDVNELMVLVARFETDRMNPEALPLRRPSIQVRVAHSTNVMSDQRVPLARVLGGTAASAKFAEQSIEEAYKRVFAPQWQAREALSRKALHLFERAEPTLFLRIAYVGDVVTALTSTRRLRRPPQSNTSTASQNLLASLVPNGDGRVNISWDDPHDLHAEGRRVDLNESQHGALLGLQHNIELICGPPATGKSATIHALVTECLGDDVAIVTAVQNRAIEALADKFASSGTGFLTAGSRLTGTALEYTLQKQVERHADVIAVTTTIRRCRTALALLDAGLKRRLVQIFNAAPAPTSRRALQRISLVDRLVNERKAVYGFRAAAYVYTSTLDGHVKVSLGLNVISACSTVQLESLRRECHTYVDVQVNPTAKLAAAVIQVRYAKAHHLSNVLTQCHSSAKSELARRLVATRKTIIAGVKAVLCTSAAAGPVLREFAKDQDLKELEARVAAVVADEAGSIGDRHVLPLIPDCPKLEKLVLVGDTKQLPMFTHVREGGAVSLMERFERQVTSALLTVQYRMPSLLATIVSDSFYDGLLTSSKFGDEVVMPLRLACVFGCAEREHAGTSMQNELEADAVCTAVLKLQHDFPGEPIVVLTPYSAQVRLIRSKLLGPLPLDNVLTKAVEILSVDASQGREWDHALLSLVSTDARRAGFLKSSRRQCVALSRAKRTMTLIADPSLLAVLPPFRAFAEATGHDFSVGLSDRYGGRSVDMPPPVQRPRVSGTALPTCSAPLGSRREWASYTERATAVPRGRVHNSVESAARPHPKESVARSQGKRRAEGIEEAQRPGQRPRQLMAQPPGPTPASSVANYYRHLHNFPPPSQPPPPRPPREYQTSTSSSHPKFRTQHCKFFRAGYCKNGDRCSYIHERN